MRSKIVFISAISFIFMGCSALMPYHEEFKCQGGSDISICKRVSDVYLESDDLVDKDETNTSSIKVENNESCKNNETKELKEMIEAISYNELKNPVEVVVINNYRYINNETLSKVDVKKLFKEARIIIIIKDNKILVNEEEFSSKSFLEEFNLKYGNLDKNSLILMGILGENTKFNTFEKIYSSLLKLGFKRIAIVGIRGYGVTWLKFEGHKSLIYGKCKELK